MGNPLTFASFSVKIFSINGLEAKGAGSIMKKPDGYNRGWMMLAAGLFCVVLIVAGCLYLIPTVWNATGHFATNIFRCGSAFSYAVFSANILFLWLILVFLVNSLSKSVKQ